MFLDQHINILEDFWRIMWLFYSDCASRIIRVHVNEDTEDFQLWSQEYFSI